MWGGFAPRSRARRTPGLRREKANSTGSKCGVCEATPRPTLGL